MSMIPSSLAAVSSALIPASDTFMADFAASLTALMTMRSPALSVPSLHHGLGASGSVVPSCSACLYCLRHSSSSLPSCLPLLIASTMLLYAVVTLAAALLRMLIATESFLISSGCRSGCTAVIISRYAARTSCLV